MSEDRPTNEEGRVPLPFELGSVLVGKYRVDQVIATGGMGIVASGLHVKLSQRIAIKFLRMWTPDGVARFEREARACAQIQSEHIARVLDVDSLPNGTPFMVMEFLDGTDLSDVLKARGHLPVKEAVDYVMQACEALAEAHRNEIIHRDLKPANLFLTRRPDGSPLIKVLDFGISKIRSSKTSNPADDLTTTNALMGSPSYMSPEQLRAVRSVDVRTDIWALGAVLYKLVAGRNPFIAESTPDLCIKILTEATPGIDDVTLPERFYAVVERCLQKDRELRYANVAELAEALRPWAPDGSVDRVVRTLGAVPKPAPERTGAVLEPIGGDTRLATTVDPSVSDTTRHARSWRAPVFGAIVVGALSAVTWVAVTHKATSVGVRAIASDTAPVASSVTTAAASTPASTTLPPPASVTQTPPLTTAAPSPRPHPTGHASPRPSASVTATPAPTTSSEFERFGERK